MVGHSLTANPGACAALVPLRHCKVPHVAHGLPLATAARLDATESPNVFGAHLSGHLMSPSQPLPPCGCPPPHSAASESTAGALLLATILEAPPGTQNMSLGNIGTASVFGLFVLLPTMLVCGGLYLGLTALDMPPIFAALGLAQLYPRGPVLGLLALAGRPLAVVGLLVALFN